MPINKEWKSVQVGFEVTLQVRIAGPRGGDILERSRVQSDLVLAAYSRKAQNDIKAGGGLLRRRREGRKGICVFGIPALDVVHWAVDAQAPNVLEAIGLRQGNPETCGARGIRIGWNVYLIGEFKRARWRRCARLRGSPAACVDGNYGNERKNENRCEHETEACHGRTPTRRVWPSIAPLRLY